MQFGGFKKWNYLQLSKSKQMNIYKKSRLFTFSTKKIALENLQNCLYSKTYIFCTSFFIIHQMQKLITF